MSLDALLDGILADETSLRAEVLRACALATEQQRSMLASALGAIAKDAAEAALLEQGSANAKRFQRAVIGLSMLRVEIAKNALLRVADEGTLSVKAALSDALRETATPEGRAVLVHLLADDDARLNAIVAIGAAPWPEALPILIEVAEGDDDAARVAALAIAKCGATAGPLERNAAADFLLEQLDDDAVVVAAASALLHHGRDFPGLLERAKRITKEGGARKVLGLCLAAASGLDENATLLELALSSAPTDQAAARALLKPLLKDSDDHVRRAAERTWRALDLD
jgi:hypothetical protein